MGCGRHHIGRRCLCQLRIGLPSGQRAQVSVLVGEEAHNFEILLISEKVKASVTSRKVQSGRSTGTCERRHDDLRANHFNSKCVFFQKNKSHWQDRQLGPFLAQPGVNFAQWPSQRSKRAVSTAVKVLVVSNDCHPLKIHEKGGEPILPMEFPCIF